jgi:hypothetical protein
MQEAMNDKVQISMNLNINNDSILSLIERIRPKVEQFTELAKTYEKIPGLREILTQEVR